MSKLLILLLLSSCSVFKNFDVAKDRSKSAQKICLSSEGKGRLVVGNKKYIFSYESALGKELANWKLALNFPLRKAEIFEIDWSEGKVQFSSTIEDKIIRENKNIDPRSLEAFTQDIGNVIKEIIDVKDDRNSKSNFNWELNKKSLSIQKKGSKFKTNFSQMVGDSHFGLMQLFYTGGKNKKFRLDLVVKSCF